ncbi:hypothetical protein J3R30DRAFT_3831242 [Lentinula aciculospora]|uniref:MFS general substrate transporter n=1 Tax=Lentinula aciculospora TaxID=153920 RepID=A0A9W8ZVV0_9AGAR|nr:hypothetical protein J3R30DRAFT_3831242 [Lentinula aciculospora]
MDEALHYGLTYLANGVGSLLGNTVTGRILDRDYQKFLEKEDTTTSDSTTFGGKSLMFIEKARLTSLMYNLPSPIVIFFFIGWFYSSILDTYSTLILDLFPHAASTSNTSINLVRCPLGAVGTSTIQLIITAMGYKWSFTTLGGICILSFPLSWLQWVYGPRFRAHCSALDSPDEISENFVSTENKQNEPKITDRSVF